MDKLGETDKRFWWGCGLELSNTVSEQRDGKARMGIFNIYNFMAAMKKEKIRHIMDTLLIAFPPSSCMANGSLSAVLV